MSRKLEGTKSATGGKNEELSVRMDRAYYD